MSRNLTRAALVAALVPAFTLTGGTPADAAVKYSVTFAQLPKVTEHGRILCKGRTFSIGYSGNPITTEVQCKALLRVPGIAQRWITLTPAPAQIGSKQSWVYVVRPPGERIKYRTRARNVVREVVGGSLVVKRGGWDQTPGVIL